MAQMIWREFLKALPKRTTLWLGGFWLALLLWLLVARAGYFYMANLRTACRFFDLTTAERFQEFFDLAPPQHHLKGMALVLSPRLAPSHGLALFTSLGTIIVGILASKLFGDEYDFGTIRRLWTEGLPRVQHLAAKLGAICLVTLAGVALTCLVAILLTPVVRWFYPIPWVGGAEFLSVAPLVARVGVQLPVSLAITLFAALLGGTIAMASRSTLAGAMAVTVYGLMRPEVHLPALLQPFLPGWHLQNLSALAFPEFTRRPFEPVTVQMGHRIHTWWFERDLPAMMGFEPPLLGPEPSLPLSFGIMAVYMLVLFGILHVVWHRQEAN